MGRIELLLVLVTCSETFFLIPESPNLLSGNGVPPTSQHVLRTDCYVEDKR